MKCKNFLLVFFLVWLSVGHTSLYSEDQKLKELEQISTELTEATNKFNQLAIASQLTLMDLQLILPELIQSQEDLLIDLTELDKQLQTIRTLSDSSLEKLTILKGTISSLSVSVATLGTSLSILDASVKAMERNNRVGIALGSIALAGVLALTIKEIITAVK